MSNVVATAAGGAYYGGHSLALRSDGTVAAWGSDYYGQTSVPVGLSNVVAVASGYWHDLALREDGTVVVWGSEYKGSTFLPVAGLPGGLSNVVAIAAGGHNSGGHSMALRADGTVAAWGNNSFGQTNVPSGLSNVVAVAAGSTHCLALRADGTVVVWGGYTRDQRALPEGLSNVVAVMAGGDPYGGHSLALRTDGTVIAWGDNRQGQTNVPVNLINVVTVAAGGYHNLALTGLPSGVAAPRLVGSRFLIGTVDRPFYFRITARNNPASYGASGLPAGLAVDPNTGLITGTPLQAGKFTVALSASNALGSDQWSVKLTVNVPLPGVIVGGVMYALLGTPITYQVVAVNDPVWLSCAGLPAGLVFEFSSGTISGTPVQTGEFPISIQASNSHGLATGLMTIRVSPVVAWGFNGTGQTNIPAALGDVVSLAGGRNHSLVLRDDGTIAAWGDSAAGQIDVPLGMSNVLSIASSGAHNLALRADGKVVAWGDNSEGQTNVPTSLGNVVAVAAGSSHSLALRADGAVVGWGEGSWGQTTVPAGLSNVVAVAAGGEYPFSGYSLALRADGTVAAWGYNWAGQTNVPLGLSNVVAIAAGGAHNVVLRSNGTVVAWGYNGSGQTNVPPGLSNVVAISAGQWFSSALRSDGTVVAWGYSAYGQTNVPAGLTNVVASTAGGWHNLALVGLPGGLAAPRVTGSSVIVGTVERPFRYRIMAANGATSYGANGLPPGLAVDPVTGLITGKPLQAGTYSVVLSASNTIGTGQRMFKLEVNLPLPGAWGGLVPAVLGCGFTFKPQTINEPVWYSASGLPAGVVINETNGTISGTPLELGDFSVSLTASNRHGMGGGTLTIRVFPVAAWGGNSSGQTNVPAGLSNVVMLAAGGSDLGVHNLALKADGIVIGWGNNSYGQANVPASLSNVVAVAAGGAHNLALQSNGTLAAWGRNSEGQRAVPSGLSNVVALAAGFYHSLALRADGTVIAWGQNSVGQTNVPAGLSNVVAVTAGSYHSLALRADGTVTAWGDSSLGRTKVPVGLSNVVAVAAGYYHSLALRANGTVAAWGSYSGTNVPVGLTNVVAIEAGGNFSGGHSLALRSDGAVVAWGYNGQGQTTLPASLSNVVAVSGGFDHSLALTGLPSGMAVPQLVGSRFLIGTVARPFHYRIAAQHGATSYGADGLPPGLTVDSMTGLITGQPLQAGTYPVELSAGNAMGTSRWTVVLVVNLPLPGIVVGKLVPALFEREFEYRIMTVNYPSWLAVSGLPAALAFESSCQTILGTPLKLGDFPVSVLASNSFGAATQLMTIRVSPLVAWGDNLYAQTTVPAGLSNVLAVAGGEYHSLVLRGDGTVIGWGAGTNTAANPHYGQSQVPAGLSNVMAVAAGGSHSLALRTDGIVIAWGLNTYGQRTVPAGLSNVVAVAAGANHSLTLRSDGTVTAWGRNSDGQRTVPSGLTNVVMVAGGGNHSLALRADGTVIAWGRNSEGQTNVPVGLSNALAVAGGFYHSLALRADGTVVAWGDNSSGQTNAPAGLSNVAAGGSNSLALRVDGTIAVWGDNSSGQTNLPSGISNMLAFASGYHHCLALAGSGPPVRRTLAANPARNDSGFSLEIPTQSGRVYVLEYKSNLTETQWLALPLVPGTGGPRILKDPNATEGSRFYRVRSW